MGLLSLCMIVKNEEDVLERCLESLDDYVDEIVIVDTGSTDRTVEIARDWADTFDEAEWNGMAAARNRAMDLATGRFLLIVDADEYADPECDFMRMRRMLTSPILGKKHGGDKLAAAELVIRNIMSGGRTWEQTSQVRIFLNRPALRYTGVIHNQYREALHAYCAASGRGILRTPLRLIHTGYDKSDEERRKKFDERLPAMWETYHTTSGPEHGTAAFHLSCMLHSAQYYDENRKLIPKLDLTHVTPLQQAQLASHMITYHLQDMLEHGEMSSQVFEWCDVVMEKAPEHSLFLYNVANTLVHTGHITDALDIFARAAACPDMGFQVSRETIARQASHALWLYQAEDLAARVADAEPNKLNAVLTDIYGEAVRRGLAAEHVRRVEGEVEEV